ncbi:colicin immunity protein, partial [Salmonella enterica subsp. enterica serovar Enteritidis]|nr:colicin immunity protein [Salmonella enterica subsp. enterica serovar Enteritidis]
HNHELTTSGKLLRIMSQNDYFLLFFFISLYASIYILSFMLLWFLVGSYKVIKERI